jgi:hypothetical protein
VAGTSEAGVTLPAVTEDMVDVEGTEVAEDIVATVAMEDEEASGITEATGITEVTAVGVGAALASGSEFTTHLCLSTIRRFGAPTACHTTTPTTTTINGTEMRTSMKP